MPGLYPFFCYFGGKWRVARRYPPPTYGHIIEPFAGAAGYSLRHADLNVTLYDVDPVISGLWTYLINVSAEEIRSLPIDVSSVRDLSVCQEAKWLIGFWLNKGTASPNLSPSAWMRSGLRPNSYWGPTIRERIASQVDLIRHWQVKNESYETAPEEEATWFVDPPYQGDCGRQYRHSSIDYSSLQSWCKGRRGQIIVCEREGATWLPFVPFHKIKTNPGSKGKAYSQEVVWLGPENGTVVPENLLYNGPI